MKNKMQGFRLNIRQLRIDGKNKYAISNRGELLV